MPEQRQQDDDGQWNAQKPKQDTSSKAHLTLLRFIDLSQDLA
jgi:hypothetical protein